VPLHPDSVRSALAPTGDPVEEELGEASVGGPPVLVALEALGDQVVAMALGMVTQTAGTDKTVMLGAPLGDLGTVEAVPTVGMATTATLLLGVPMETLGILAVSLTAGMDKTVM